MPPAPLHRAPPTSSLSELLRPRGDPHLSFSVSLPRPHAVGGKVGEDIASPAMRGAKRDKRTERVNFLRCEDVPHFPVFPVRVQGAHLRAEMPLLGPRPQRAGEAPAAKWAERSARGPAPRPQQVVGRPGFPGFTRCSAKEAWGPSRLLWESSASQVPSHFSVQDRKKLHPSSESARHSREAPSL